MFNSLQACSHIDLVKIELERDLVELTLKTELLFRLTLAARDWDVEPLTLDWLFVIIWSDWIFIEVFYGSLYLSKILHGNF